MTEDPATSRGAPVPAPRRILPTGAAFRRVGAGEAAEYHELVAAGYGSDAESRALFRAAEATPFDSAARLGAHPTWGLEIEGRLAAVCSVRLPWSDHPGPWAVPHLGWITTHPDFRGRGLAAAIVDEVLAVLGNELFVPAVSLGTAREHSVLPGYYRRHGWAPVEDRDLGLGHITTYFIRTLDTEAFERIRPALGIPEPIAQPKGTP